MKTLPALTAALLCSFYPACNEQTPTPLAKTEQAPPSADANAPEKVQEKTKSPNGDVVGKAWAAYGKKDFEGAIAFTELRLASFKTSAQRIQDRLTKEGVQTPIGKVSKEQKQAVFNNGMLNDVAVCYYIKGLSLVKLGEAQKARDAFQGAVNLSHGRAWDPKGHFWSPAASAAQELEKLK